MSQDFVTVATPSASRAGVNETHSMGPSAQLPAPQHHQPHQHITLLQEEVPPTPAASGSNANGGSSWQPTPRDRSAGRSPGHTFLAAMHADPNATSNRSASGGSRAPSAIYRSSSEGDVGNYGGSPGRNARQSTGSRYAAELVQQDRDLATLRDDLAARDHEVQHLKAALQREHEAAMRNEAHHARAMEALRVDTQRQTQQLSEQLAVVKSLSEGASSDKDRIQRESDERKRQLMALLESERDEKSRILADYRSQTEQLIAEQNAEIQGLRELLDAARREEEKFVQLQHRADERRLELDQQIVRLESALDDERQHAARQVREAESRQQLDVDSLRRENERRQHEMEQQVVKAQVEVERREDTIRSLNERLAAEATRAENEKAEMRGHYDGCVESLTQELQNMKANKTAAESDLRAAAEEARASHDATVAALRKELDALRKERQDEHDEGRRARDVAQREASHKVRELQEQLEDARGDVLEERTLRKDAEASQQTVTIKCESLQSTVARLNAELEAAQVDARARQRQLEQQHLSEEEALRSQVRALEAELARTRQAVERAEGALERTTASKEAAVKELHEELENAVHERDELRERESSSTRDRREQEARRAAMLDELLATKVRLETENHRLSTEIAEADARQKAATRQLAEERDALDRAVAESHRSRDLLADVRTSLDAERSKCSEALSRAAEAEAARAGLEEDLAVTKERLGAVDRAHREADAALAKERQERQADAEHGRRGLVDRVEALEAAVAEKDAEISRLEEAAQAADERSRKLRDDAARWEREAHAAAERAAERVEMSESEAAEEMRRLEAVIAAVRDECAKAQHAKAVAQREAAEASDDADRRVALVQESLDHERAAKHRLHDEMRSKEHLAAEVQGTMQLLTSRVHAKEGEISRLEEELRDATKRVHEAHTTLGQRDATIGQLNARLKVREAGTSHHLSVSNAAAAIGSSSYHSVHQTNVYASSRGTSASGVSRPLFGGGAASTGANDSQGRMSSASSAAAGDEVRPMGGGVRIHAA